jgi:ATF/CREB family transcription factor
MTEEEKRKNFLERNRQGSFFITTPFYHFTIHYLAALKCRQRKKAWLAQLQAKVEYLENENERLTTSLVSSREEISRLSAIVGASGVSSTVGITTVPGGTGSGVPAASAVQGGAGAPISVNLSLPGSGKTVAAPTAGGGGRGYGY